MKHIVGGRAAKKATLAVSDTAGRNKVQRNIGFRARWTLVYGNYQAAIKQIKMQDEVFGWSKIEIHRGH